MADLDKTFAAYKTNKLFSKIHEDLLQNGEKMTGTELEKWAKGMNRENLNG